MNTRDPKPKYVPKDYEIVKYLGSGQTSHVYLANHARFGELALKLPRQSLHVRPVLRRMFENEVQITVSLNANRQHKHVIRAFEGYPTGEKAFLSTEYCAGGSLDELLNKTSLDFRSASRYIIEVARGLAYAHSRQVFHRDVKPANILLDHDGVVKLADFGTGIFMTEKTKDRVGTAYYMAPEIFEGKQPTVQADIYSLGILAYEVLTNKRPFVGSSYDELMLQHLSGIPRNIRHYRKDIPESVSKIVSKAMSRDPGLRFNTTREFIDAYNQALEALNNNIKTGRSSRTAKKTGLKMTKAKHRKVNKPKKAKRKGLFAWLGTSKD